MLTCLDHLPGVTWINFIIVYKHIYVGTSTRLHVDSCKATTSRKLKENISK